MPKLSDSHVGLLLSGGLDSCILLGEMLGRGHRVQPIYIRSKLVWEHGELDAARRYLDAMASPRLDELIVLDLPMDDLYRGHWCVTGHGTPPAGTVDEAVYLAGRNPLLIVKAAVWCRLHEIAMLALGVLGSNPFADATGRFFDDFQSALATATGGEVELVRPFAKLGKRQVMQLGAELPLELTFSCISPTDGMHCGRCNKCAERHAAFQIVHVEDPTRYAAPQAVSSA